MYIELFYCTCFDFFGELPTSTEVNEGVRIRYSTFRCVQAFQGYSSWRLTPHLSTIYIQVQFEPFERILFFLH